MKKRYSDEFKATIVQLTRDGVTYAQLQAQFGVSKSLISYWCKKAGSPRDRKRQLRHLKKARIRALESIHRKKDERIALATARAVDVSRLVSTDDVPYLKVMLAMLYWAEGTKSDKSGGLNFVNTDPVLMQFYVALLRKCYILDESKFRVRVHTHEYHDPIEAYSFWSKLLQIPESQFGKIYVKKTEYPEEIQTELPGNLFRLLR